MVSLPNHGGRRRVTRFCDSRPRVVIPKSGALHVAYFGI